MPQEVELHLNKKWFEKNAEQALDCKEKELAEGGYPEEEWRTVYLFKFMIKDNALTQPIGNDVIVELSDPRTKKEAATLVIPLLELSEELIPHLDDSEKLELMRKLAVAISPEVKA